MALVNQFSKIMRGAITATGNTVVANGAGVIDTAYMITPTNTLTSTWQQSGTLATLSYLAVGTTIESATLYWYSTTLSGTIDVTAFNGAAVSLTTAKGNVVSVTPTTVTFTGAHCFRSADITSIVQTAGPGNYTCSAVPTAAPTAGTVNGARAGWCIVVAWSNPNQPYRSISYDLGVQIINPTNPTVDVVTTGFVTPPNPPQNGFILLGCADGDPTADNSTVSVGPNISSLTNIGNTVGTGNPNPGTAPNNPNNAFFSGQINNCNPLSANVGLLETQGTRGSLNQQAFPPTLGTNVRNKWDLTMVNIGRTLTNNQTSLTTRIQGVGANAFINLNMVGLQIDINAPNLTPVTKSVDKTQATIGDTLVYTIAFSNLGTNAANNLVIIDTIPNGTSFISGTVFVDGVNKPSDSPQGGINVGTVAINQRVTVTFNVTVTTLPTINPMPNSAYLGYNFLPGGGAAPIAASDQSSTVNTFVNYAELNTTKQVNKTYANVGDILTYTIPITNTGNTTAISINFIDTIPNGTTLQSGSLTQNGVLLAGSPNPPGVTLNNINPGATTTIVFKVLVNTIPSPNPIPNAARTIFSYTVDSSTVPARTASSGSNTNIVNTQINNANLSNITKYTDRSYADCGSTINYTIVIPNTGNVTALNVVFKDTIPNGTSFVTNSVYINGAQQMGANPATGISVPNIAPGATTTLTFSVVVNC